MASNSKKILPMILLAALGCRPSDDDGPKVPGFIFQCVDERGCGHADESDIDGRGDVFGPVAIDREFRIYYGTVRSYGYDTSYYQDINPEEGVEVVSFSNRSYSHVLHEPGLFAFIAMRDGQVVDYMHVEAKFIDTGGNDAGIDSEVRDTGVDSELLDAGVDSEAADTGSDTVAADAGDVTSDDGTDFGRDTETSDSESETVFIMDSDEMDAGMDGGVDTEAPMDAGVDGGMEVTP